MKRLLVVVGIGVVLGTLLVVLFAGDLLEGSGPEVTDPYEDVGGEGVLVSDPAGLEARGDGGARRREEEAARRRAEAEAARQAALPAEGIRGYVTDAGGRPIGGARVSLAIAPARLVQWAPLPAVLASATTDEKGAFLVGPAPKGKRLLVRAEASGYAPTSEAVAQRGTRVDLVLDRGGRLEVRVLDMEGAPVADARVMHAVGRWWQSVVSEATTGVDGVARFSGVPTGSGNLVVAAPGHAAVRQNDVAVSPDRVEQRTVVLEASTQITGKVLDGRTDQPVRGAQVRVHYPQLAMVEPSAAVATEADGSFRVLADVAAGEQCELRVRHADYAESRMTRSLNPQEEVVVKLQEAGEALTGRVVASDGGSVAGVTVTYIGLPGGDGLPEVRTNEMGEFTLPRPPWSLGGVSLLAMSPRDGIASRYVRLRRGKRPAPIVLTLPGAGDIEGLVRGRGGDPVQGALISVEPDVKATNQLMGPVPNAWQMVNLMRQGSKINYSAVSDADGRFRIEGVPAMAYRVKARYGGDQARTEEPVLVQAGMAATAEVTLAAGGTIEGYVVDSDERPVSGAYVYAQPADRRARGWGMSQPNGRTQSDGHFVLHGVEDWDYTVYARAAGYGGASDKNVRPGTTDLTLHLAKLGWIQGVVLDERGGPYRGTFRIHVDRVRKNQNNRNMWLRGNNTQIFNTDDGRFEVRGRAAGKYNVRASTSGGLISLQQEAVEIVNGRGTRELRLQLGRGGVLKGVVRDEATGKPLRNAYVYVNARGGAGPVDGSGATSGNGRSNAKGEYEIKGLGAGTYTVNVWANGANWSVAVDLASGETKTLALVKRQPGSVQVRVVDQDGSPVQGAYPTLRSTTGAVVQPNWNLLRRDGLIGNGPNAWQEATTTGADGINVRYHVPPGRYQVTATRKGYGMDGEGPWIEVVAGAESTAEVKLKQAEGGQ